MTITQRDLRTMVDIAATPGDGDTADPLPVSVLTGLCDLISCDNITFTMFDARRHEVLMEQGLGETLYVPEQDREPLVARFWTLYWDSMPCCYPDVTGDLDRITTIGLLQRPRTGRHPDVPRIQ